MSHNTGQREEIDLLYRSLDVADSASAVSVILKLRGETCNIDCLYCYEKRKATPGGARIDAGQVHRLAELFRGRRIVVELHGGEPLTAGIAHVADVLSALAAQPSVVGVSLQTNGVLLDEQWLDLFEEVCPDLRIGISLDGDSEGNRWRVGYDGRPVYPRVAAALQLLADRGRQAGVICAVTPSILSRAEAVLDHIAGFHAVNAVSFVPCFDASVRRPTAVPGRRLPISRQLQQAHVADETDPSWAIDPDQYADFVIAATIRWISAGYFTRMKLEPAVSTIRRLRSLDTTFCHFSNLKCDHVFTLYPDGRLGSCDELPWPQARLTVLDQTADIEQVAGAQQHSTILAGARNLMGRCATCEYRTACGGGCLASRLRSDLAGDQDAYCDYRIRMINGIAALLAQPADPAGAWCQTLRWSPREPNSMRDIAAFLARWNNPDAPREDVRIHTSLEGNINTVGLSGVHEADDLDPAHPRWHEAIEPGIRSLVDAVTCDWRLVTYDSCEGHSYTGRELPPAERRVGILPRDRAEYATTAAALCRVAMTAQPELPEQSQLLVGRCDLTCEATGRTTPVLDLRLRPAPGASWSAYFAAVDTATNVLVAALRREKPTPGSVCACSVQPATTDRLALDAT
ncbi:arylsulfatase regulator (Fe-S oxidoreductase) [Frankia sp. CcI6]|uniref:radical SAM/SPASM domain-containing protein n=1 Tax=unclassified Frankia TaxID=2632575 RepID=UPI0003CFD6B5|nr:MULTISPECIES: radical SAM protein [unclassified Frankia]ETA00591.1 arylsulfatase regulator (Fe-S oxidoreductase) [Frankia sp. CcI6]OHV51403.1 radical SAM/SPASM domain-containing protein [Frankia sp. CgIS1]